MMAAKSSGIFQINTNGDVKSAVLARIVPSSSHVGCLNKDHSDRMISTRIILTMLWLASGSSDATGEAPRVKIVSPAHGAVFQVSFVRKRVIRPSADLPDLSTGLILVNPRACF